MLTSKGWRGGFNAPNSAFVLPLRGLFVRRTSMSKRDSTKRGYQEKIVTSREPKYRQASDAEAVIGLTTRETRRITARPRLRWLQGR